VTAPPALAIAANFAINASLRHAIEAENFDAAGIQALFLRAATDHVARRYPGTQLRRRRAHARAPWSRLEDTTNAGQPPETVIRNALAIALALRTMPFDVNLWQAQNIWNELFRHTDRSTCSVQCKLDFKKLGEALYICVEQLALDEGISLI
jgi:hypothetical protein